MYSYLQHEIGAEFGKNGTAGYRHTLKSWPITGFVETGRMTCEFPESLDVHIRFDMKFSEGFGLFAYGGTAFWKVLRLWQSKWTGGEQPPFGVSGQLESNYIVVDLVPLGSNQFQNAIPSVVLSHYASYRSTSESWDTNYAVKYETRSNGVGIPFGTLDANYVLHDTDWVQCDLYYRLGDTDADNGEIRQWYNGVEMVNNYIVPVVGSYLPSTGTGLVTNPRSHWENPPGFNQIHFLDNYAALTGTWTEQHYVYIDNFQVFTGGIPNDLS